MVNIAFETEEWFKVPARLHCNIYAISLNPEVKVGWVPRTDLGPGILFGNFIGRNRQGIIYCECINTGDKPAMVKVPKVTLRACKTMKKADCSYFVGKDDENTIERVKIMKMCGKDMHAQPIDLAVRNKLLEQNPEMREKRVDQIMEMADTKGCNVEEIKHIRELITEHAGVFARKKN